MDYRLVVTAQFIRLNNANSDRLDALAPGVFDNPIDPVQLRNFLDDPRHIMVVAIKEGMIVGMASAVEFFHPDKRPQLWINEVGVSPNFQRQGIGRRLTAALVGIAKELHNSCVWVGTDKRNIAAQACFGSVTDVKAPQEFLLYEWDFED